MRFLEFMQGRFMRHPMHPMFVHLPVGLWVSSLILDILYFASGNASIAIASYYCIAIGLVGALIAAPTGLADLVSIPVNTRPRRIALLHMGMNLVVVGLYAINFFVRRGIEPGSPMMITVPLLLLSIISVLMLSVSGYLGGLLVYDYGIGMKPHERTRTRPDLRRAA